MIYKFNDFLLYQIILKFTTAQDTYQEYLSWVAEGNTPEQAD